MAQATEQSFMSSASSGFDESGFGSQVSVTGGNRDQDSYPDEIIPIICCIICVLFIIMIILLLLISNLYVTEYEEADATAKVNYRDATKGATKTTQSPARGNDSDSAPSSRSGSPTTKGSGRRSTSDQGGRSPTSPRFNGSTTPPTGRNQSAGSTHPGPKQTTHPNQSVGPTHTGPSPSASQRTPLRPTTRPNATQTRTPKPTPRPTSRPTPEPRSTLPRTTRPTPTRKPTTPPATTRKPTTRPTTTRRPTTRPAITRKPTTRPTTTRKHTTRPATTRQLTKRPTTTRKPTTRPTTTRRHTTRPTTTRKPTTRLTTTRKPTTRPTTTRKPTTRLTTTRKPTTRPTTTRKPTTRLTTTRKLTTRSTTTRKPTTRPTTTRKPTTTSTTTRKPTTRPTTTRKPTTTPPTTRKPTTTPPATIRKPTAAPTTAVNRTATPMATTPRMTTTSNATSPSYENRKFTLICVFEYLSRALPRSTPQCTDYVYIRFFVYSHRANSDPLVFEPKKFNESTVRLYYDETRDLWRKYLSYRTLDTSVRSSKRYFPLSRWFLGMWGSAYIRLMAGLWDASIFREALHGTLRSNFSDRLAMSDFNGFAIINSLVRDTRPRGRAQSYSHIFRGTTYGAPILEPKWVFIHTAAIWPGGNGAIPESMLADILREADVVGLSTSNSTDEPNIILQRASSNPSPYLAASPPNPIMPAGPGTRGMLDILKGFPHWKQVLGRNSLCFSVTSSINYVYSSVDKIDFIRPMRSSEYVQRYSRLRFVTKIANQYPVQQKNTSYYFDNSTRTHYWRYMGRRNELLRFFAYDTGDTLQYKVTEMLNAYGDDKCVVFDDLGDDSEVANITVAGRHVSIGRFELLHGVHSALKSKYGGPFAG